MIVEGMNEEKGRLKEVGKVRKKGRRKYSPKFNMGLQSHWHGVVLKPLRTSVAKTPQYLLLGAGLEILQEAKGV